MKRLTEKEDWSSDYKDADLDRRLDDIEFLYRSDANMRELFDRVVLPILARGRPRSVLEIGSAPGQNLIEVFRSTGAVPYGIEYTEEGAALNRRLFRRNGVDPANVRCEDFFSAALDDWRGKFDATLSLGFVEHFEEPQIAIRRQIDLCGPEGCAVVTIPNLQGIYYWWNRLFNPRVIETHNIKLMRSDRFFHIFEQWNDIHVTFKGYVGSFEYGLLTHRGQFVARAGIWLLRRLAPAIQMVDRHVLSKIGLSQAPYQVVVANKRSL